MIVLISRSLVATSCSIGVKRKKLSRLNNVTSTSLRRRRKLPQCKCRVRSAETAAQNQYAARLATALTGFRTPIFHALHLRNLVMGCSSNQTAMAIVAISMAVSKPTVETVTNAQIKVPAGVPDHSLMAASIPSNPRPGNGSS